MSVVATLPRTKNAERDIIITADGSTYYLSGPEGKYVVYDTGTGMPEIDYVTQRGPFQHGETVKDYFLRPRVVELRVRQNSCSRNAQWTLRDELLNMLRPNRGLACTLRKIKSDGTMRDLTVTIQSGPRFEPRRPSQWDEWSIDEVLRFIAYNPVYYDPLQRSVSFGVLGGLTFPITFPITFSASGSTLAVTYAGTWLEYPVITITGPLSSISIWNQTTNERISFTYPIAAGRVVTFNLGYGVKTVTLDDGTNLIGYVGTTSDFAQFHLQPGVNTVQVLGSGSTAATAVAMSYYNRYIGI